MHATATCKSSRFDIVYVVRGHSATRKVWRRKDEHGLLALAGYDKYAKQVPASRMIPLWGGVGPGGFALILRHSNRKTDNVEWSAAVRAGDWQAL